MRHSVTIAISLLALPLLTTADNAFYCPQNHAYIRVGMTQNQVIAACGQPLSQNKAKESVVKKTPVIQLIYTNLGQGSVYNGWTTIYNTWSLPSGSVGMTLEVDIVEDKVDKIRINGSNSNAMSLCNGQNIEPGQSIQDVYSACGGPSYINNTYTMVPVPDGEKPEVWTYQIDRYRPLFTLTFVGGELQSINP